MPPFSIYSAENSWEVVLRSYRTRLTLSLATALVLYLALTVSDARAVDVVVAPVKPTIDGALGEWGAVAAIDISPAGDGLGCAVRLKMKTITGQRFTYPGMPIRSI